MLSSSFAVGLSFSRYSRRSLGDIRTTKIEDWDSGSCRLAQAITLCDICLKNRSGTPQAVVLLLLSQRQNSSPLPGHHPHGRREDYIVMVYLFPESSPHHLDISV